MLIDFIVFYISCSCVKDDLHVAMSRVNYRSDGVRIQHNPYAEGMSEKYGKPGETDAEGFDPYAG
jgi:hypothetical protein